MDGRDLAGNDLPGLPNQIGFVELLWRDRGRFFAVESQAISSQYADNANESRIGGYALLNLRGGFEFGSGRGARWELFGGVDNILNRGYFGNVRVNANADRALEDRAFFEPAPGVTAFVGVAIRG